MHGKEFANRRNMMRRNYWIIAVAALLLIVSGDVVYWRIAVEQRRPDTARDLCDELAFVSQPAVIYRQYFVAGRPER